MAKALSGCVIVEDKGNMYHYQKKCDSCSFLLPGKTLVGSIVRGSKKNVPFVCPKCKSKNKVIIQE